MAIYVFTDTQMKAVADAIRAKTGKTNDIKIEQMPTEIASISSSGEKTYKEVWLHAAKQRQGSLYVNTGIPADLDHTIEVIGYGNIYASTTLFGSVTSAQSRQVVDLLTSTNKLRIAWGNSGLKVFEYTPETWTPWLPFKLRVNKSGYTLNGHTSGFSEMTDTRELGVIPYNASTNQYRIFPNVSQPSSGGATGVFRSAKIYDASMNLIHDLVPIMYSDWTMMLLDKVTGIERDLKTGVDGFSGYWEPYYDSLMNLI